MRGKLGLFVLALVCAASAEAQAVAGFGAVVGRIRDTLGDGLPDTTVVISNDTLGVKRTVRTTDDGQFTAMALPPGTGYNIKASRAGFAAWEYKDLDITLGSTVSFVLVLQPEAEAAPTENRAVLTASVEDNKFDVSTLVSQRQLQGLPDRVLQIEDPILLAPGVIQDFTSGFLVFRGEPGTSTFMTDSMYTVNTYFYEKPGMAPQVAPDSVREMQVIAANASSEYGHGTGGAVNTLSHSGTENYHGDAYGFFSDHAWDAADRYGQFHPAQQWEQAGASMGGPLQPGKLYFFANLEGWQGRSQGLNQLSSPLLAGPQGTSLASNCSATAAQCAAAIAFLAPQVNALVPRSTTNARGFARVDYRRSDRNNLTAEVNGLHDRSPNGAVTQAVAPNGELLGGNGLLTEETRFAKGEWTSQLNGTMANELRAGWFKDRVSNALNPALEPSTGAMAIRIAGASVGSDPMFPRTVSEQRTELADNIGWTLLTHTLKFGFDGWRNFDWTDQLNQGAGAYDYPSLTAFATDFTSGATARNYTSFSQTFNHPVEWNRTVMLSGFGQDNWRPLRRLNVMAGVHWEKYRLPKPQFVSTAYYETGSIASQSNAFAPRIGLTYLLDDRTVVRVGGGAYTQPFTGDLLRTLLVGNAIYQTNITVTPLQTGAPAFPQLIASNLLTPTQTQNVFFGTGKLRLPYAEVMTFGIERRLTRDTAAVLSYVENRGTRLWTVSDGNLIKSTINRTYLMYGQNNNYVGTYITPIWTAVADTTHAHVYSIDNSGLSRFRSITGQLRKAMSYGLAAQISFTWSHTFDDVSGPPLVGFIPATLVPAAYRNDESNSSFDQRYRLSVNWTWQPRPLQGNSVPARLLNDWQVSGIFTEATGLPETPTVMVSGQQFAAAGKTYLTVYTNSLNGSGGWARVPWETAQLMRTDTAYVANLRVTRVLPVTERIKAMLMFEAYNALNRQYGTSLDTVAYTANVGLIRPVPDVGIANATNGYPFGTNARYCQVALRLEF